MSIPHNNHLSHQSLHSLRLLLWIEWGEWSLLAGECTHSNTSEPGTVQTALFRDVKPPELPLPAWAGAACPCIAHKDTEMLKDLLRVTPRNISSNHAMLAGRGWRQWAWRRCWLGGMKTAWKQHNGTSVCICCAQSPAEATGALVSQQSSGLSRWPDRQDFLRQHLYLLCHITPSSGLQSKQKNDTAPS